MPRQILQVNMHLTVPVADYKAQSMQVAPMIAQMPGVIWKVWLLNVAEQEVGGIYLFEDESTLQNYVSGPLASLTSDPSFKDIRINSFGIIDSLTAITHGPVGEEINLPV